MDRERGVTRNTVRASRLRRGITLVELARRTGLHRLTIIDIEKDDGSPVKSDTMFALARALNTEVGSLFWDEPEPRKVAV